MSVVQDYAILSYLCFLVNTRHVVYPLNSIYHGSMSFQAYLDNVEQKTGKTPNELIALANGKGFDGSTKAGEIVAWLKQDFDLGRGHAMAIVHVIKNGAKISDKHVDSKGTHSDPSSELRLDGIKNR